jgi:hypothetical protein
MKIALNVVKLVQLLEKVNVKLAHYTLSALMRVVLLANVQQKHGMDGIQVPRHLLTVLDSVVSV